MTVLQRERMKHPMFEYHLLLAATVFLFAIGLIMVASASSVYSYQVNGSSYSLALRQALFGGIGCLSMWYASNMKVSTIRRLSTLVLLGVIASLVLVLVIGTSVNGQQNWIEIWGPFRFQPSEFAKLAIVVWGAHILALKWPLLNQPIHLMVPYALVCVLVIVLIGLEGDVGTAIVMGPIMASPLFFVGAPKRWFVGIAVLALVAIAVMTKAAPYRIARFTSWRNQGVDEQGAGYQLFHGQLALGSGGWTGLGLGASREKWGTLPEAHTDFIYAILGEELGILGTLTVLLLFMVIAIVAVRVARNSRDHFVQLTSMGIAVWIMTQMIVNIGAVLGVMPITGVPLPLVSYGGSSLIPTLIAMGVLMAFAKPDESAL